MKLTTITPYWSRPAQLERWAIAMKGAAHPEVQHFVFCNGFFESPDIPSNITVFQIASEVCRSIGHAHNKGAYLADTEWIMKMDVDCLPNVRFFTELLKVLETARPREWFNCGMFYMNRTITATLPNVIDQGAYRGIVDNPQIFSESTYLKPQATNFICRREDYLNLGGCDPRFQGWGWEDYQQIYMLERHWLNQSPFGMGAVTRQNVTTRCRDGISRPKASQLFERSVWLSLLHCWHPKSQDKSHSEANKDVLFDYIQNHP